jgi:hypothetical protein
MNIREKFLELTSKTYPHGTEEELFGMLSDKLEKDEFGNLYINIGDNDVMFTSHLDTATAAKTTVTHVFEGNIIKTDGTSILGADDKAGVVIMLNMIEHNIPGLYYFFLGEEVGCVGSKKLAAVHNITKLENIKKVISFDRRGTTSVISCQGGSRCASDKFTDALAAELNRVDSTFSYKTDPTGIYTDSAQFVKIYPECTNISVGYKSEHTFSETQDIEHLEKLANAVLQVDWTSLPVERDPSKVEYTSYGYGYSYGWDEYDYGNYGGSRSNSYYTTKATVINRVEKKWIYDKKFNFVSSFEIDQKTNKVTKVDLCKDRIDFEKQIIKDLLKSLEVDFFSIDWDGLTLNVYYSGKTTTCDRNELYDFLPELDYGDEIGGVSEDLVMGKDYLDSNIYD